MGLVVTTAGISAEKLRDLMTATVEHCFARQINLHPRTKPTESPQSNGMAEAFVRTMKRGYVRVAAKPRKSEAENSSAKRSSFQVAEHDGSSDAATTIREVVETVVLHPVGDSENRHTSPPQIEVIGRLALLLGQKSGGAMLVGGPMVAEEGLEPPTRGL